MADSTAAPFAKRTVRDLELARGEAVLARVEEGPAVGRIVAVRQGPLMATSFHPEWGGDARIHQVFVDLVLDHRH